MTEQKHLFNMPFLNDMKKIVKSLNGKFFEVKEDSNGDFSVYFKRVIIIGPLPKKNYADSIAEELNVFIRRRKKIIELALEKAEKMVFGACTDVADAITGGSKEGQSNSVESDSRQLVVENCEFIDNDVGVAERLFETTV